MKANPGGQIDLREVVGRDEVINQIWDTQTMKPFATLPGFRFGEANLILSDNDKIIRQLILIMCQQIF